MIGAFLAIGLAWCAGLVVVLWCWPRGHALPWLALLGLAGVIGPATAGAVLLACGALGVPVLVMRLAVVAIVGAAAARAWSTRRVVVTDEAGASLAIVLVVVITATTLLSLRTHLGWDGTVVWFHKARMITASGGAMPVASVADRTRAWTAPDYPLQVPLAMAWITSWQGTEDEHSLKLLPAAWCAAVLCLIAAGVLDGVGSRRRGRFLAAAAVIVAASTFRLVVGEGSLTSGYADGPLAAWLLALLIVARRSEWGARIEWVPLLALLAVGAVWTKQEGLVVVGAMGALCLTRRPLAWRPALLVTAPALMVSAAWMVWVARADAPMTMAYAWPGGAAAVGRVPVVLHAYGREAFDTGTWGLLWPVLLLLVAAQGRAICRREFGLLIIVIAAGASAFLFSGWPDLGEHLAVTVPRQLIQVAPALLVLSFGQSHRPIKAT